jgi:photosystem II stability/assembly factor-like uncharacterized protein
VLSHLTMVTPRVGWALVGSGPYEMGSVHVHAVVRTSDGGRTWRVVSPAGVQSRWEYSFGAGGTAWAWLEVEAGSSAVVLTTTDGGSTWTARSSAGHGSVFGSLQFLDPLQGWLTQLAPGGMGSSAVWLLATGDAGRHWHMRMYRTGDPGGSTSGALPFGCFKLITFVTPSRAFAGGECHGGPPFLYLSTDGGRRWRARRLPFAPHNCDCDTSPPVFFSRRGGYLTSGRLDKRQRVYLTDNAGRSWRLLPVAAANPMGVEGTQVVSFPDARHGWAITGGVAISRTVDGGRTWQRLPTPFDAARATIQFVSARAGFATVGYAGRGQLWATEDGGRTWRRLGPSIRPHPAA